MKKFLKIILVLFIIIIVPTMMFEGCHYAKLALSHDEKDIVGVFETIHTESEEEYQLNSLSEEESSITFNENGTYDMSPSASKGTYEVTSPGILRLDSGLIYNFIDDRYLFNTYDYTLTEDEEYGLAPTFDDNGRTEQTFSYYYADSFTLETDPSTGRILETANGDYVTNTNYREIIFEFNDDGTYKIEERINDGLRELLSQGTYQLDRKILMLSYDGGSMPLIYDNNTIYFDVYEKQK